MIKLPVKFARILTNSDLEHRVEGVLHEVSTFIADPTRSPCFFPEYTDHGPQHIQAVLDSAAFLVTSEAVDVLTDADVFALVVAVCHHDVAMHLTADQFGKLVTDGTPPFCDDLDDDSWSDCWTDYLAEASRWSDATLSLVLADESHPTADLHSVVKSLEDAGSPETWDTQYKKFIGEFIRRHHARMAHEFAVHGIPLSDGARCLLHSATSDELSELAGIIARSHHMALRDVNAPLVRRFHGSIECLETHPIYLAALLRIADYLQVEAVRAPETSTAVRQIRNPFSKRQWAIHQSVKEVRKHDTNDECLLIRALPTNVAAYLDLRALLDDIQRELDMSHAVLGEVYGAREDLRPLRNLQLKRVCSNIDDVSTFQRRVQYLPHHFSFTADPDLVRLLIQPLYGERPEIAVRELLQNAIDATRERCELEGIPLGSDEVIIEVAVYKEEEEHFFRIYDRGVGMTARILDEFFLRVGASIRYSSRWTDLFTQEGKPRFPRIGRFGVGVLAGFLLGDEIEVLTRHMREADPEKALHFSTSLSGGPINVQRSLRAEPVTTITIRLSEEHYKSLASLDGLEWDWFRWRTPQVVRSIDGNTELPRLSRVPEGCDSLSLEWRPLETQEFDAVFWTYGRYPRLVANGLNIGTVASSYGYSRAMHFGGEAKVRLDWPFRVPYVAARWTHTKLLIVQGLARGS